MQVIEPVFVIVNVRGEYHQSYSFNSDKGHVVVYRSRKSAEDKISYLDQWASGAPWRVVPASICVPEK